MEIIDAHEYSKNSRTISDKTFQMLGESLEKLGDLGGIVLNRRTQEVISGNQRTKWFKLQNDKVRIELLKEFEKPEADGTVAYGFVYLKKDDGSEVRYAYREVDWDDKTAAEANIKANKLVGFYNDDLSANFEAKELQEWGFSDKEISGFSPKEDIQKQETDLRQFVVYFNDEEYSDLISFLDKVMGEERLESYKEVILKIIDHYKNAVL